MPLLLISLRSPILSPRAPPATDLTVEPCPCPFLPAPTPGSGTSWTPRSDPASDSSALDLSWTETENDWPSKWVSSSFYNGVALYREQEKDGGAYMCHTVIHATPREVFEAVQKFEVLALYSASPSQIFHLCRMPSEPGSQLCHVPSWSTRRHLSSLAAPATADLRVAVLPLCLSANPTACRFRFPKSPSAAPFLHPLMWRAVFLHVYRAHPHTSNFGCPHLIQTRGKSLLNRHLMNLLTPCTVSGPPYLQLPLMRPPATFTPPMPLTSSVFFQTVQIGFKSALRNVTVLETFKGENTQARPDPSFRCAAHVHTYPQTIRCCCS